MDNSLFIPEEKISDSNLDINDESLLLGEVTEPESIELCDEWKNVSVKRAPQRLILPRTVSLFYNDYVTNMTVLFKKNNYSNYIFIKLRFR